MHAPIRLQAHTTRYLLLERGCTERPPPAARYERVSPAETVRVLQACTFLHGHTVNWALLQFLQIQCHPRNLSVSDLRSRLAQRVEQMRPRLYRQLFPLSALQAALAAHESPREAGAGRPEASRADDYFALELLDEGGASLPGVRFALTLPNREQLTATSDSRGAIRIDPVPSGGCRLAWIRGPG